MNRWISKRINYCCFDWVQLFLLSSSILLYFSRLGAANLIKTGQIKSFFVSHWNYLMRESFCTDLTKLPKNSWEEWGHKKTGAGAAHKFNSFIRLSSLPLFHTHTCIISHTSSLSLSFCLKFPGATSSHVCCLLSEQTQVRAHRLWVHWDLLWGEILNLSELYHYSTTFILSYHKCCFIC